MKYRKTFGIKGKHYQAKSILTLLEIDHAIELLAIASRGHVKELLQYILSTIFVTPTTLLLEIPSG